MNNNELETRMDRIIEWVKVCDTKASIMLALVGVMLTFAFSNDFVLSGIQSIFHSAFDYDFSNASFADIRLCGVLAILCLFIALYSLMGAIYRFIMVVYSIHQETLTDPKKDSLLFSIFNWLFRYDWPEGINDTVFTGSLIHFYHISKLSYDKFVEELESNDYKEHVDFLSQIYINAKRCSKKFEDYNAAIRWMLWSFPFMTFFFLFLLFFVA